jgi:hypothetical protein
MPASTFFWGAKVSKINTTCKNRIKATAPQIQVSNATNFVAAFVNAINGALKLSHFLGLRLIFWIFCLVLNNKNK